MLGAFLDRLTSVGFSRYFVIGNFFPLVIAAFLNVALAYEHGGVASRWIARYFSQSVGYQAWAGTTFVVALGVVAYLVAGVANELREFLEGRNWPSGSLFRKLLSDRLIQGQLDRLEAMESDLDKSRKRRRQIKLALPAWKASLAEARALGQKTGAVPRQQDLVAPTAAVKAVTDIADRNELPGRDTLEAAVAALKPALKSANASLGDENSMALDVLQVTLTRAMDAALARAERDYTRDYLRRQAQFGSDVVLPTRFGNISESMRSYTEKRYELPLDIFWPRFQMVLQADTNYFATLQDAKSHLDFLVALFWLTGGTTLVWLVILAVNGGSAALFLLVAILGPLLTYWWYDLATTAYASFAEIVRSSVDLFRMKLLTALHIGLPRDLPEERELWTALTRTSGYGEPAALRYHHS